MAPFPQTAGWLEFLFVRIGRSGEHLYITGIGERSRLHQTAVPGGPVRPAGMQQFLGKRAQRLLQIGGIQFPDLGVILRGPHGKGGIRTVESLTYRTNTSNADSFSLISYIYRKIPEPEPDRFYRLSSLVAYPFSYPFFANRLLFPQEYTVVIENKNFSEKISLFSDVFLFVLRTELLLTMWGTWSAGVFFIYDHVLLSSVPDALPRIRAPPLAAPYSGQTPETSPGVALAVTRDAHVLNSSPTRLKRTSH